MSTMIMIMTMKMITMIMIMVVKTLIVTTVMMMKMLGFGHIQQSIGGEGT